MNKKLIFLLVIIVIVLIVTNYICFNQHEDVKFEYLMSVKFRSKVKLPCLIFYDKKNMDNILYDWIGYSITLSDTSIFNKYDLVLAFGTEIDNITYYKYRKNPDDDCDYLKKIPVNFVLKKYENLCDSIFVYRIEKNKYRTLCP
jgi:hypothetical protein